VLLLDEPASGLDPRARIEMRELLKELRRLGKTIIISSHILHELAELCNTVGIIERGQLLFSGTVDEIVRRARLEHTILVTVSDRTEAAAGVLRGSPGVKSVDLYEDPTANGSGAGGPARPMLRVVFEQTGAVDVSDLPSRLIGAGFRVVHFAEEKVNLETAFMRLTQGLVQ